MRAEEMVLYLISNLTFKERKIESFLLIHTHHSLIETLISTMITSDQHHEKTDNNKSLRQKQPLNK